MVNINLESIIIYADAEPTLKDMFDPRIEFYAIVIAWDSNGKVHTVYGNLPLQLSYNDTRRYNGDALPLFTDYDILNGLNICIFAYHYNNDRLLHKRFLRQLKDGIDEVFSNNNKQITDFSEKNIRQYRQQISENIKSSIEQLSKKEAVDMINVFEDMLDMNDVKCDENLSIINHYRKMGGIKLYIKT